MTLDVFGGDCWARWLLERRFGGDIAQQRRVLDQLYPIRDRVLAHAAIRAGDTVLDIGAGDGLIAFGALDRVGKRGTVILSDISEELLNVSRSLADQMGVRERCRFLLASATNLSALPDSSVDVVTTRSVLIYVEDKRAAFDEFHRVLRPGGRLSVFEPINRFGFPEPPDQLFGYDVTSIRRLAEKVRAVYHRAHPLESDPMMNFDERDLLGQAEAAQFGEIHLEYQVDIGPNALHLPWDAFLGTAFNPRAPTLAEAMRQSLTEAEAKEFEAYLHPLMDRGPGRFRRADAYLWAVKR